ncbi:MAG: hypothetical protein NZM07_06050 [Elioraea sp.]|nr:hypothetical protein [Elioraea sp.]
MIEVLVLLWRPRREDGVQGGSGAWASVAGPARQTSAQVTAAAMAWIYITYLMRKFGTALLVPRHLSMLTETSTGINASFNSVIYIRIDRRILGHEDVEAFVAGAAIHGQFLARRGEDALRFVAAWRHAIMQIIKDREFRGMVLQQRNVPREIAEHIPIPLFRMVRDLKIEDLQSLQDFANLGKKEGIIEEHVDILQILRML